MATRTFIDTNILIYAEVGDQPAKKKIALALLKAHCLDASGVLSTQVLQEYCNVAIKKLKRSVQHVREQLAFYEQFDVVPMTPSIIRMGLDLHQTKSVSFYDSLILASAISAGCSVLLSEDMNSGEVVGGLTISNPFQVGQRQG